MDRYGGSFGADDAFDGADPFGHDDRDEPDPLIEHGPLAPPSPVGQDERRMQVRAYNHWASLLGTGNLPLIAGLDPRSLDDFGPYGVLLYFGGKRGIDDPAIRFLGAKLAEECGGDAQFRRLSDVPGRSLLSRITDHYLQILANQAPIGFEAEFTNQRGANVLYRGILMPWSSDGVSVDYVFGVINWKEMADAATADALFAAIDAGLESVAPSDQENDMDRMLDLSGFAIDAGDDHEAVELPAPAFGGAAAAGLDFGGDIRSPFDQVDEDAEDEEAGEPTEWGAGFSGFGDDDRIYAVDYGAQGLESGEEDEDFDGVVDPLADDSTSLGLSALVSRSGRVKQSVVLPGMGAAPVPAASHLEPVVAVSPRTTLEQRLRAAIPQGYEASEPASPVLPLPSSPGPSSPVPSSPVPSSSEPAFAASADHNLPAIVPPVPVMPRGEAADPGQLYDCLAAARDLAQTASSSEDRGRKALYQAVARAYDFSIEAAANPGDFEELLAENGLTVQDRAPMTPIVKLVFGADYDKTRLTEYATVLGHAHRTGVPRGTLEVVLARAQGGLKGVVQAERLARKEADGKPIETRAGIRPALAKKLRKLDAIAFDDLAVEGAEFALVLIRRLPSGEPVVLGEVPDDAALIEKAARKLVS